MCIRKLKKYVTKLGTETERAVSSSSSASSSRSPSPALSTLCTSTLVQSPVSQMKLPTLSPVLATTPLFPASKPSSPVMPSSPLTFENTGISKATTPNKMVCVLLAFK